MIKRIAFRRVTACRACGRSGHQPCPGHEYGGMIYGRVLRRPFRWMARRRLTRPWLFAVVGALVMLSASLWRHGVLGVVW